MFLLARARALVARHPWVRWALIVLLAAGAATSTATALRGVDRERQSWGSTREVWVATADAAPGEVLRAERRRLPLAVIPRSAAANTADGGVARQHIGAGEIVTRADLTSPGWVAPGEVALALPTDGQAPLTVGDRVRIFAAGAALSDGRVVAIDEASVVVAVPADVAPAVSAAATAGAAVAGRLPP